MLFELLFRSVGLHTIEQKNDAFSRARRTLVSRVWWIQITIFTCSATRRHQASFTKMSSDKLDAQATRQTHLFKGVVVSPRRCQNSKFKYNLRSIPLKDFVCLLKCVKGTFAALITGQLSFWFAQVWSALWTFISWGIHFSIIICDPQKQSWVWYFTFF